MAMKLMQCKVCQRTCWHNPTPVKEKGGMPGWRCTHCGYPLGTGPKADRMKAVHERQVRA